ncbi:glycosyltransferase [Pelagibacterales bacterium SAG-MED38]|nr:glycosyltransferase [Pelagibacterales bacterium SAG-MED38]
MKKNIFYWSPCINPVGTVKSTLNSAISLKKFNQDSEVSIINACGEWDEYKEKLKKNSINLIDLSFKYFKILPKTGFLGSRISYIIIFLLSFLPLFFLLKKHRPNKIILHLITSLPLTLLFFFNLKYSFILRISGYPKLNILRKFLWKINASKLSSITCPTIELKTQLEKKKIFNNKKLFYLPDAIISLKEHSKNTIEEIPKWNFASNKKIILSGGRLTKQKNFIYLINEFENFYKSNKNFVLVILGDGEDRKLLENTIKEKKLEEGIFMLGHRNDIYNIMRKSDVFVLSSLWEEMGFVIVEAAMNNLFVISSDCPNGPREFLDNGRNGILFSSNKKNSLKESLEKFDKMTNKEKFKNKVQLKKNVKKFTRYRHFKILNKILSQQ